MVHVVVMKYLNIGQVALTPDLFPLKKFFFFFYKTNRILLPSEKES